MHTCIWIGSGCAVRLASNKLFCNTSDLRGSCAEISVSSILAATGCTVSNASFGLTPVCLRLSTLIICFRVRITHLKTYQNAFAVGFQRIHAIQGWNDNCHTCPLVGERSWLQAGPVHKYVTKNLAAWHAHQLHQCSMMPR
mgnify:CR=1 FL=1